MNTTDLPHPCDFVREAFQLRELPNNVQLVRRYDNMRLVRFVRRLHEKGSRYLFGSSLVNSEGKFGYSRGGTVTEIKFNGLNAQYHALYEQHFKHGYEFETAVLLTRLLTGSDAFYDVGANWGYFSLLVAASRVFTGPVYAFEPNPKTYDDLTRTIQQAALDQRITALNYGLGRNEGELHLEEPEKYKSGLCHLSANGTGQRIPVHTLDTINLAPPRVIKVDAEGMETDIFMGGEKLIKQHRPFLVFENFLNFDDPVQTWSPLALLQGWGYKLLNPALVFNYDNKPVLASYGDPLDELLKRDSRPKTALVEITQRNRFLMRRQLNVFACHETRLDELAESEFVRFPRDETF